MNQKTGVGIKVSGENPRIRVLKNASMRESSSKNVKG